MYILVISSIYVIKNYEIVSRKDGRAPRGVAGGGRPPLAAVAEEDVEQTLIMSKGTATPSDMDFGTDPTISSQIEEGTGFQYHHYFTHYSPLIDQDTNGNIIPWMAESYEVSDDYDAITFHLRKGIKFADGTPFNASVAKFNFDRYLGYGWRIKGNLASFAPVKYYDYSEVLDEYSLKVQFTQGWLDIARDLSGYASFFISPWDVKPSWDIKGTLKSEKRYNGLGAYYVDENESIRNQKVVLNRRHSWRDDLNFHVPTMDQIVLTLIADPHTAVMALEKGEINYIQRYNGPPLESLLELEKNPDITIKSRPAVKGLTYAIQTAWWKEPFNGSNGILLRKAINYALDRDEIVNGVFFGYATPATDTMYLNPLWPGMPECCHKGYDYNIDKAKQYLAESGWTDTDGDGILDKNGTFLKDLNFVISSSSEFNWMLDTALMVQHQLKKIGIDVKIQPLEYSVYGEALKNGEYDLALYYTSGVKLTKFNPSLTTAANPTYANENNTLQDIAYKAEIATSIEELNQYRCQACNILYEEAGIIPLVHSMNYAVMSSKIRGYEFRVKTDYYDQHIEECWIED